MSTWLWRLSGANHHRGTPQNREGATVMSYTQLEDYAATACAIQNAMLSMEQRALVQSGRGYHTKVRIRNLFRQKAMNLWLVLRMCILKDNTKVKMPRKRRPLLTSSAEDDEAKRKAAGWQVPPRNILPVLTTRSRPSHYPNIMKSSDELGKWDTFYTVDLIITSHTADLRNKACRHLPIG